MLGGGGGGGSGGDGGAQGQQRAAALAGRRGESAAVVAPAAAGLDGASSEAVLLQSGDGFDAARVLLLGGQDDLLVAVPDRDVLWAGPAAGQDLSQLMRKTARLAERAEHPVSPNVYRVSDGRLEPVRAGDER